MTRRFQQGAQGGGGDNFINRLSADSSLSGGYKPRPCDGGAPGSNNGLQAQHSPQSPPYRQLPGRADPIELNPGENGDDDDDDDDGGDATADAPPGDLLRLLSEGLGSNMDLSPAASHRMDAAASAYGERRLCTNEGLEHAMRPPLQGKCRLQCQALGGGISIAQQQQHDAMGNQICGGKFHALSGVNSNRDIAE